MKKIIFYTIIFGTWIFFNGCCAKKYCEGIDEHTDISLNNFTASDVDSVAIEIFQMTPNGKVRIDSIFQRAYGPWNGVGDFIVYLSETPQAGHNYKVTLCSKNMGQVYIFSDLTTQTLACNHCFLGLLHNDYTILSSCLLNGQIQYYNDLRIVN